MKKAVQFGAGNIGCGFIGQLFSRSEYEVAFIKSDPEIFNLEPVSLFIASRNDARVTQHRKMFGNVGP